MSQINQPSVVQPLSSPSQVSEGAEVTSPTAPQVAVPESKEDIKFKENFERINKQEKHQQELRRRIDEERKALEADKAEVEHFRKIKALKATDPFKMLEEIGITFDDLVLRAANKDKPIDPIAAQALAAVEKIQKQLDSERAAAHKERLTRTEQQYQAKIAETVKAGGYDVIESLDMHRNVWECMEEMYNLTGEIIPIDEACKGVTEYVTSAAKKIQGSKWLQEPVSKPVAAPEVPKATLTNKLSQTSQKSSKPLTDKERMEMAIKAMKAV